MHVSDYTIATVADAFKALGEETRLRIVHLLAYHGELCVCDVESTLRISQSKASRHLTYLKHAGIVEDRRDGTWIYYRLVRGHTVLSSVIRSLKKSLTDDAQAQADLQAAKTSRRDANCAPISIAKKR